MKQVTQTLKSGEITVVNVPLPAIKDKFILVKNTHSVISSGTEKTKIDMGRKSLIDKARARPDLVRQVLKKLKNDGLAKTFNTVKTRLESPSPLGYSCAGEVVAIGGLVEDIQVGDIVACGGADFANHAEYVAVPKNLVVKVPDRVSNRDAAFATVGSIALQGVRLAEPKIGETFLVIGLGLIGQITSQILKSSGCNVIGLDINELLINQAKDFGVVPTDYENCENICRNLTDDQGVDGVLICAGTKSNEPINLSGRVTREKGRVVVVGAVSMDIPREDYFKKEINVVISRSYGPGRYDSSYEEEGNDYPYGYVRFTEKRNMKTFLEMVSRKQIDIESLVSHNFHIDDAPKAYNLIEGKKSEHYMGILLHYSKSSNNKDFKIEYTSNTDIKDAFKISFFGAGNYATSSLLPILTKNKINLSGVVTGSGRTAEAVAKKFNFNFCSSNFSDLLDEKTDVIMITSRHNDHAKLVYESLKSGKHVYVEKPLALNFEELSKIYNLYKDKKIPSLMVGFNRRFSKHVKLISKHMNSELQSMIINIRVNAGKIEKNHWINDPNIGGGRIIGEACHFIDLASALSKSLPTKIYATNSQIIGSTPLINDNASINIKFESGAIANIIYTSQGSSLVSKEYIEVFCNGLTAVIDDFKKLNIYKENKRIVSSSLTRQDKGQAEMLESWLDAIKNDKQCIPLDNLFSSSLATIQAVESIMVDHPLEVSINTLEK